ncbi:hypothetical protein PR048_025639 [Dryococelus australis]|uniref:Uncharacterized protein n=1 Tax=Dryococelus australis TaxID=614101 RepID=A0ABQ9GRX7_9NEOP|nr:hypothetical protein PR048_025639 [Dryococelus australis]
MLCTGFAPKWSSQHEVMKPLGYTTYLFRLSNRQRSAVNRDDLCLAVTAPPTDVLEVVARTQGRPTKRTDGWDIHSTDSDGGTLLWLFMSTILSHQMPVRGMAEDEPSGGVLELSCKQEDVP